MDYHCHRLVSLVSAVLVLSCGLTDRQNQIRDDHYTHATIK